MTTPPWARAVAQGLIDTGVLDVVYVPDNPLSHLVRAVETDHPGVRTTIATREEEAFGIAAGLYLGGRRPAVLLQSSGLGNSINALASLLVPYRIPALLVISMRGEEDEWNAAQAPMARTVRPVLEALGIRTVTIHDAGSARATLGRTGALAFDSQTPAACLLPRRLTAPETAPDGGAT